ncbi:PKD-like domain-containing protein, partial [Draconibacterium sediminis]|uniref:PKD-like domain-containing protein n=1 Tax=Draconibacterium sediminis TaxID=1544798 RepID=UPI0005D2EE05
GNTGDICFEEVDITITEPADIVLTTSFTEVTCNGAADGTITASATGGATITVDGVAYDAAATYGPGTYTVRAEAAGGNTGDICFEEVDITITEPLPLTITTHPISLIECEGHIVTFTAAAINNVGTLTYTWQRMLPSESVFSDLSPGGNISFPAIGELRIANVGSGSSPNGTQYRVEISDDCGTLISDTATLNINEITDIVNSVNFPSITLVEICEGDDFSYTVVTSGQTPVSYQWKKYIGPDNWQNVVNSGVISGANDATLQFTGVTPADSGEYKVTVTFPKPPGADCNVTSDTRTRVLTIRPTPTVIISGDTAVCQYTSPNPWIKITNPMGEKVLVYYNVNDTVDHSIVVDANASIIIERTSTTAGVFNYNFENLEYQSDPKCLTPIGSTSTITVHPTPSVETLSNKTYCNGDYISGINFSGTPVGEVDFNWESSIDLGFGTIGTGNIPAFTAINNTDTLIIDTITVTPTANGCFGPAKTFTISIRPTLRAYISGNDTVCLNDPSPYITFTNPIGLPVTVTYDIKQGANSTRQPLLSIPANDSVQVAVPTSTSGTFVYDPVKVAYQNAPVCDESFPETATVVVNPAAVAIRTPESQPICSGDSIVPVILTSTTPDVSYSWEWSHPSVTGSIPASGTGDTIRGALINNTATAVTVNINITPIYDGCPGVTSTARVTVYPIPELVLTPDSQMRCSGEPIGSISPSTIGGGAGTFYWVRDHLDDVVGVDTSGTGAVPSSTITNLTDEPITVSFIFTTTSVNGCEVAADTAVILVNPTPQIVDTSLIICDGGTFDVTPDSTYGVAPDGTTYEWSINSPNPLISGAASGSGNSITGTLFNSSNSAQSVIYAVTPYYGNECPRGDLFLLTVTVTPEPDIDSMSTSVCSEEPFTVSPANNTNGIVPSGTTYEWEVLSTPNEVDGASDGSGPAISDTLVNTSNTNQLVSYTVWPTAGDCEGDSFIVEVNVKPTPAIIGLDTFACSEETFTVTPNNGTGSIVPSGTTYSWAIPNMPAGMTGGSPGSGASSISGTLTNHSDTVQTAIYTVTPAAGGCVGDAFTLTVTVNPKPAINPIRDTICSGEGFDTIPTSGFIPAGTTYSWLAPAVTGIEGESSGTNEASISDTLTNTTTTAKTVTYTVTPKSGDCNGIPFTVTIVVNPTSDINDMSTTVCNDQPFSITPQNGVDGFVPVGTTYNWLVADPVGTGATGGSGDAISDTLTNLSDTVKTVVYVVTPIGGCSVGSFNLTVYVNPEPDVTISGDDTICYGVETPDITFINHVDLPVTATYKINGGGDLTVDIDALGSTAVPANINQEGILEYSLESVVYQTAPSCSVTLADTVVILVEPITTVSVSRTPTGAVCFGEEITFVGDTANAGTAPAPTLIWYVNGSPVASNSDTLRLSTLNNTDKVWMEVTTFDTPCPDTIKSNVITMTVNPLNIPEVTIYESLNGICEGDIVTFYTDLEIYPGTNPTFEWFVNDTLALVGENIRVYPTDSLSNGDQVKVVMTPGSSVTCPGPPDTSNVVTMIVYPKDTVSVSLSASADTVCAGSPVTYTATPTNGGSSPSYQWYVDSIPQGSSTSQSTFVYTPTDGQVISVVLTSSETCVTNNPAISDGDTIAVNTPVDVEVSIIGDADSVCDGNPITFTATPIANGGSSPSYQWYVDGNPRGNDVDTFSYVPTDGDIVTVELTSSDTCVTGPAISDPVNVIVNPNLPVSVSIAEVEAVCSNEDVTVVATPVNGGSTPMYQWYVKDSPEGPLTSDNTLTYSPEVGDSVYVVLTSSETCTIDNTATSNKINIPVDLPITDTVATPTGDQSVCSEAQLLQYKVDEVANATNYIWNLPIGWTLESGAGTDSITVRIGANTPEDTYYISVQAANSCDTTAASSLLGIYVGEYATADVGPDTTICFSQTSINIDGNPGGAANSAKGSWISSGTGVFGNSNKPATDYTPSAADRTVGTVTLTFTTDDPKGSTCDAVSDDLILTLRPELFANISDSSPSVCEDSTASITFKSHPNTVITYNDGVSDQTIAIGASGTAIVETAPLTTTTTFSLVSVDWASEPSCSEPVTGSVTITVVPAPTVDAGGPDTICQSSVPTPVTLDGASVGGGATTGTWSITPEVGSLGYTSATERPDTVTYFAEAGFTGTVTLTLTTDLAGVCSAVSATRTIVVQPEAIVDAGEDQTVCPDDIVNVSASVSGGALTGSWSHTGSGSFVNPSALNTYYTPGAADITAGTVTLILTSDDPAGPCGPVSDSLVVTIKTPLVVDAGANDTICQGSSVTLEGSLSGDYSSASWIGGLGNFSPNRNDTTAVYTPTAAEVNAGTVTLILTANDPLCGSLNDTTTIFINKAVVITEDPVNTGACVGDKAELTVTAVGTGLTYQWYKDGLALPGETSDTLRFNSVSLSDDGSYYVWVKGAPPCDSVQSNPVTLNVDQAITINTQPVSKTLCEGANVTFSVNADAGGIPLNYQWYKVSTPDSAVSTASSFAISGITTTNAGDYYVVVTAQSGSYCSSVKSDIASLIINIEGTIDLSVAETDSQTVCMDSSIVDIAYIFDGSANGIVLTGFLPNGVDTVTSGGVFTISGIPIETGTFDFTVTTTGSPCVNPSLKGQIIVEDAATISLAGGDARDSLCVNNPLPTITYLIGGNADSATITWDSIPDGINTSYNSANGQFTISGTPTTAGTYPFTVKTVGSFCGNPELSGAIKIKPDASIEMTSDSASQILCIGSAISPISYTIGGSAISAVITSGSLPNGVNLTPTNDTVYTISGTPTEAGTFSFTVSTTGDCLNVSETAVITVEALPDGGSLSPSADKVCTEINNGTVTLQNYTGNILRWESSVDAGYSWDTIPNTSGINSYDYENLGQFTQFRAVVGNATCGEAYSSVASITVVPSFVPVINASGGNVCTGEEITLWATASILPDTVGLLLGGSFNRANMHNLGWNVLKEDGTIDNNIPAGNNNTNVYHWALTNGPKDFCYDTYTFDSEDKKFAIVSGGGDSHAYSWMETPMFNLIAMSSAELTFDQAYIFSGGATGTVWLSTDGGASYNVVLAEYSDTLMSGMPNVVNPMAIDLASYIGMDSLRIRFEFDSPNTCSVWALDNITIPTPQPDIEYEWGPVAEIPGGSGELITVVPPTTTTYTLTVYINGCPGTATDTLIAVYDNPEVFTSNTCVGDTVTFEQSTEYTGYWEVSGGGDIDDNGLFTADSAGCFVATFTTISGDCFGTATFMVFPDAPLPDVDSGCGPINITPPQTVAGFDIQYNFYGGDDDWTYDPTPPTADNCDGYPIQIRYITAELCDTVPIGTINECSVSPVFNRKIDLTSPTFTVPNDTTLTKDENCEYSADPSITGNVTNIEDNCSLLGGQVVTYVDDTITGTCADTIFRYWTVMDDCGNPATQIQTIAIADNGYPPTFTVPGDVIIYKDASCNYDASPGETGSVTDADDNCAVGMVATYADTLRYGPCVDTIYRYWTVADDCGSETTKIQTITILDVNSPEIYPEAQDSSIQCSTTDPDLEPAYLAWLANRGGARASDLCSDSLVWTVDTASTVWVTVSPGNVQRTVKFTVTDDCLNSDSTTAIFSIIDTVPPEFTYCPDDVESVIDPLNCTVSDIELPVPEWTEECGADLLWTVTPLTGNTQAGSGTDTIPSDYVFYSGQSLITYVLIDWAGNTDTCSFIFWPKFVEFGSFTKECPIDSVWEAANAESCDAYVELDTVEWTDPCYELDSIWNTSPVADATPSDASGTYPIGTTEFKWYIKFLNGTLDSCEVKVVVADVDPPVFTDCPGTIEGIINQADCEVTNFPLKVPAWDEYCEVDTLWYITPVTSATAPASGTGYVPADYPFSTGQTRITYVLLDQGGNTDTCSFIIWPKHEDFGSFTRTCPTDSVGVDADPVSCDMYVELDTVVWDDPCNELDSIWNNSIYADSPSDASGTYPIGEYEFKWYIRDVSGSLDSCTVKVVVADVDPPVFTDCPGTIEGIINQADCEVTNFLLEVPMWNEYCEVDTLWYITPVTSATAPASGTGYVPSDYPFSTGQTRITYVLLDQGGNTDTCSFIIWPKHQDFGSFTRTCPPASIIETVNPDSCGRYIPLDTIVWDDPCNELDSIWNNSEFRTSPSDASGTYPIGTTTFKWFIKDVSGSIDSSCIVSVTVNDLPPELIVPNDTVIQADFDQPYASDIDVELPYFYDNCDSTLTWEMWGATSSTIGDTLAPNVYVVHSPDTFNLGVTYIEYTFEDGHGNILVDTFTITVLGAPEIDCPPDTTIYLDPVENDCDATYDPGVPELIEGVPPITWSFTIEWADGRPDSTGSYTSPDPGYADPMGELDFPLGVTWIYWRAENVSGYDTCSHWVEVIDTIPPTLTADPYENCVDPLHWAVYDPDNATPTFEVIDPLVNKAPVDYRTIYAEDTILDLTSLEDNCCDSTDITVYWRIEFDPTPDPHTGVDNPHPTIYGTGQPSAYKDDVTDIPLDILLYGDGVTFQEEIHHIFYWAEDCHGNVSDEIMREITITPRPQVIKTDY